MSFFVVGEVSHSFGAILALDRVSLAVEAGERRAIIGPNGAGKSTLFDVIGGELRPAAGRVWLDGRDITRLPVHRRATLGLGRTFQTSRLFAGLTAFENVRLAVGRRLGLQRRWFRPLYDYDAVAAQAEAALERVGLRPQRDQPVAELAHGQQRALEIALALAAGPRLLLLDEPTAGLSPGETAEIGRLIAGLPRSLTLLIVEHDMDVVFGLAERITVLHHGRVIADGAAAQVRADERVQEIYLGRRRERAPGVERHAGNGPC
jgi:branched-chain amino acid transport system ATP-binding protein